MKTPLIFLVLFIPLCRSGLPPGVFCLLSEDLPLTCLMVKNPFSFWMAEQLFSVEFQVDSFFLSVLQRCFFSCIVFSNEEKPTIILVALWVMSFFLEASSPITGFEQLDYDVLLGSFLNVFLCLQSFLDLCVYSFYQIKKISSFLLFNFYYTRYNILNNLLAGLGEHN